MLRLPRRHGVLGLVPALLLIVTGCDPSATESGKQPESGGGLLLPKGFTPVALPEAKRKEIFAAVHILRAKAVLHANSIIPMDEDSLPKLDTPKFDKRVADHKALIDEYLAKEVPALAVRFEISDADLAKIEEEARILRWVPPPDPKPDDDGPKKEG